MNSEEKPSTRKKSGSKSKGKKRTSSPTPVTSRKRSLRSAKSSNNPPAEVPRVVTTDSAVSSPQTKKKKASSSEKNIQTGKLKNAQKSSVERKLKEIKVLPSELYRTTDGLPDGWLFVVRKNSGMLKPVYYGPDGSPIR